MPTPTNKMTKRQKALQEENREALRAKIAGTHLANQIDKVEEELAELAKMENPNNGRIGALKTLLDSKWKRVSYVLPQVKAVEISGDLRTTVVRKNLAGKDGE